MDTLKQYEAARRVSVPLVIWKTPDAAATISAINNGADYPIFSWDIVRGVMAVNEKAKGKTEAGKGIQNPVEILEAMQDFPADSVLFMHNMHLFTDNPVVVQAVWNLRDSNKSEHKMLVMLSPQMQSPMELSNDILVIDEKLPDDAALREIVKTQSKYAKDAVHGTGTKFNEPDIEKAVDALSGLSAFSAEQSVAVSFEKNGDGVSLNQDTLWERKRQAIEETRGLSVWREGVTLDDVQGCSNVKNFARLVMNGKEAPRAIVFLDEFEKQVAGAAGDLSGVSQDQHMQFLTEMQNRKAQGMLLVGHPGSAKSMFAKAFGNSAGIVTIQMDVGAMKGSLQGESEKHIRAAFKVIEAVSQGRALYVATCNKISGLSPEMKRRFKLGVFFFDLPTLVERAAIWKHYVKKFDLSGKDIRIGSNKYQIEGIDDEGWTGADIEACCHRAWMFSSTLGEAAKYATPICKTDPQAIEALRRVADNKFISANYEGLYQIGRQTVSLGDTKRKMTFK